MIQEFSKLFRELALAGIDWILASGKKQKGINAFSITSSGASQAITFAAQDCPDMADTDYTVIADGETTNRVTVDEDTKTTAGFTLLGGTAAEIVHVHCIGRLDGMPEE